MAKAHETPLDPAIVRVRLDTLRIFEIRSRIIERGIQDITELEQ